MKIKVLRRYPIKKNKQLKRLLKKGELQLILNRQIDADLIKGIQLAINCFNCEYYSDSDVNGGVVVGMPVNACKKLGEKKTQYAELITTNNLSLMPDVAMLIPYCSEFKEVD